MNAKNIDIPELVGKRAVLTLDGVIFQMPIDGFGKPAYDAFYENCRKDPDRPCVLVIDGQMRNEYGRPMDAAEIRQAMN
jgi:hypothetical protein